MTDHLLLAVGIGGLVTSTIYTVLAGMAALRFALRRRQRRVGDFCPPVSLLKPLHGAEPELEAHLESFFLQSYPRYEILFCARNADDEALAVARRVAARYPRISSKFLVCGEPPCANAKVWSLECMSDAARYEIFVVSDSDVSVTPEYLREVIAPFAEEKVGLVTCLYRGVAGEGDPRGGTFWSRLEAAGMSVEMPSGVLVAEMLEGMKFALGPTMAVRRVCVEKFGGFDVLGSYHADDFALGNLVAERGSEVVLSTYVVEHHILNTSFFPSLQHNIRWMRSTRFSRPKGHLGTALTFSMPYAILAALVELAWRRPELAALLLAWGVATRMQMALLTGGLVVREKKILQNVLLFPVRDLFGFCCWAGSYLGNGVSWRGETYHVLGHRLLRIEPQVAQKQT
ncbi:MAG TPA: bacteriohopanetetrol glucosamine biosynthesis glycosyltransferase HpnI [Acidobacteriaceae bacterium]|jgi:ceramide glucosyltransferase|nr:bacteriohopanetetrol glucosamine biosynthesis glycosyltransferase HpnI [Acidobacteriaceae bacterium]